MKRALAISWVATLAYLGVSSLLQDARASWCSVRTEPSRADRFLVERSEW
jgi:hypothetical protein